MGQTWEQSLEGAKDFNDDVIRPSAEEIRSNPRASPAKLRWAVKA
jgi:16S rRNA C1402 N4-methylase RsmH